MDSDRVANRHDNVAFTSALLAFLMWLMFVMADDAKIWLALGVVTTVATATFWVLAALRRLQVSLEQTPSRAPDSGT